MVSTRYEIVLERLDQVLRLGQEMDVPEASSSAARFPQYRACLERLVELSRRHAAGEDSGADTIGSEGPLYLTALVESTELGDAANYLATCPPDTLRPKLRTVLRGPVLPTAEDESLNQARNVMFELTLATKLSQVGVPPHLGEQPDLWCEIEGKRILIECKRPLSPRTVKDQISQARRQLSRQLRDARPGTRGVIALSLSKVLNRGDKVLAYSSEPAGRRRLADELTARVDRSMPRWRTLEGTKILGLVFHVIMPAHDRAAHRYVVAQQMELHTWGRTGSVDERIGHALGTALQAVVH